MSIAEFISTGSPRQAIARRPAATLPNSPPSSRASSGWSRPRLTACPPRAARHALDGANVVIYDRALTGVAVWRVAARHLCRGGGGRAGAMPSAARCVALYRRRVERRPADAGGPAAARARRRVRELRRCARRGQGAGRPRGRRFSPKPPMASASTTETRLDRLAHLVAASPARDPADDRHRRRRRHAARVQSVAGNGLAG